MRVIARGLFDGQVLHSPGEKEARGFRPRFHEQPVESLFTRGIHRGIKQLTANADALSRRINIQAMQ